MFNSDIDKLINAVLFGQSKLNELYVKADEFKADEFKADEFKADEFKADEFKADIFNLGV